MIGINFLNNGGLNNMGYNDRHEPWMDVPDSVSEDTSDVITLELTLPMYVGPDYIEFTDTEGIEDIYDNEYALLVISSDELEEELINAAADVVSFGVTTPGDYLVELKVTIEYSIYGVRFYDDDEIDTSNAEVDTYVNIQDVKLI
jgi:hypothetical protein